MRFIKKLFKFVPAICLAVLSGLSVVLFEDYKLTSTNADYEKYPLHNEEFSSSIYSSYTDSSQLFPVTNETRFYLSGTFSYYYVYTESGQEYHFSISLRYQSFSSSYYGSVIISDRTTKDYSVSNTITQFRIDLTSFDAISRRNDKVDVAFTYKVYLNTSLYTTFDDVITATLMSPSSTVGYSAFHGVVNQTIMNITYQPTDYDLAFADGYNAGYNSGFSNGYISGQSEGYNNGYDAGYQAGVDSQQSTITDSYNDGYSAGYEDAFSANSTATTIFSGILQVGMLPINVLLAIFNFEVLGINLSAFVSAILTVCLTVIVIRNIKGGGGD